VISCTYITRARQEVLLHQSAFARRDFGRNPAKRRTAERLGKVKKILTVLPLCIFLFFTIAESGQMQREINHLINRVQHSGCTFIRNGKEYTPEEAAEHILNKYDHFKDKITNTEAFIAFCATKSILTNQPYKMSCPGQNLVESKDWLLMELRRFRIRQVGHK